MQADATLAGGVEGPTYPSLVTAGPSIAGTGVDALAGD